MRFDYITIFPEYFTPLSLSLLGKAAAKELVTFATSDLREFAEGNHKSVDDTPYGGGAGMVMNPVVWGEAIDAVAKPGAVLIILTPAGQIFNQQMATKLASYPQVIFACGRYEGIDQRVTDHYLGVDSLEVIEVSIGDYVLNGGEVAALAITEAVVRLLPGVIGNPDSLLEESHTLPGLEYPNYTKPPIWRGLAVPEVLLSGNHAKIDQWRREQAHKRTEAINELAIGNLGNNPDTPTVH